MPENDPYPRKLLLTTKEVMNVLSLSKTAFYELLKNDPRFPKAKKVGKGRRWAKGAVYAYVATLSES